MKKPLILLSMIVVACSSDPEPAMVPIFIENGAIFPPRSTVVGTGAFTSYAHNLSGIASIYSDSAGVRYFTLQQFTMNMGPDVHVYLSKSNNYGKGNVIELGELESMYAKDSLAFDLAHISYASEYKFALVYCVEFSSLFGYAELK